MNKFEALVAGIKKTLGKSGLDSDDVDIQDLTHLMDRYTSNEEEWSKFAVKDATKDYTRNLVDEGNGNANLLILVWTPGKKSPIHDHGNAHCLMKILKGEVTETRYDFPNVVGMPMEMKQEQVYKTNQTAYMADELGLHSVSNKGSDYAVSLHLYTPPNVAKHGCHVFDVSTGNKKHCPSNGYTSTHCEVRIKADDKAEENASSAAEADAAWVCPHV